jgi:cobalt-precorrin 5A hydrolase
MHRDPQRADGQTEPLIVAGFGFRAAATLESLLDALNRTGTPRPPGLLATAEDKAPALAGLAARLNLPLLSIPKAALAAAETATRSATVAALRGTGSVAEAAALVAAGPGASLLGPRAVSADRMATCALAARTGP